MTREDIIRMARESGFCFNIDDPVVYAAHEHLAALHAAHEREECAKVCDSVAQRMDDEGEGPTGYIGWVDNCAAAIRARGGEMTDRELMQQALDALEYAADDTKPEGLYGCECLVCKTIPALRDRLAQSEQETGNLLKDAYNAMVEKKTRSQKLREAGFTRRPKGWEKEKDEQKTVAHTLNCVCGAVWDVRFDGVEEMVHAPTPPQRPWVGLTEEDKTKAWAWAQKSSKYGVTRIETFAHAIEATLRSKNT